MKVMRLDRYWPYRASSVMSSGRLTIPGRLSLVSRACWIWFAASTPSSATASALLPMYCGRLLPASSVMDPVAVDCAGADDPDVTRGVARVAAGGRPAVVVRQDVDQRRWSEVGGVAVLVRNRAGNGVQVVPTTQRVVLPVLRTQQASALLQLQRHVCVQEQRAGLEGAGRHHNGAAGGAAGVDRLLDRPGVESLAVADRAVCRARDHDSMRGPGGHLPDGRAGFGRGPVRVEGTDGEAVRGRWPQAGHLEAVVHGPHVEAVLVARVERIHILLRRRMQASVRR